MKKKSEVRVFHYKCTLGGELQFTLSDVLNVLNISDQATINEIIRKFGGAETNSTSSMATSITCRCSTGSYS